jgi:hypothetical protein
MLRTAVFTEFFLAIVSSPGGALMPKAVLDFDAKKASRKAEFYRMSRNAPSSNRVKADRFSEFPGQMRAFADNRGGAELSKNVLSMHFSDLVS